MTSPGEPSTKHDLNWLLLGLDGLRPGWSCLLFAAIYLGTLVFAEAIAGNLLRSLQSGSEQSLSFSIVVEAVEIAGLVVALAVMALIEGRRVLAYGLAGRARAPRFLAGLGCGFFTISVLVSLLWRLGYLVFNHSTTSGAAISRYAPAWAIYFLFVAVFEELLLRGYLQFTLTRGLGFWWSALLLSCVFGYEHSLNNGESPIGLLSAGLVGMIFSISLWYTGSLWWAIGFHAAWDWGQSFFYGTADSGVLIQGHLLASHPAGQNLWSGGITGPEGSLLVLPLLVLVGLCMCLWWRRRSELPFRGSGWKTAP